MGALLLLLALGLCPSIIGTAQVRMEQKSAFLQQEWSPDWIDNTPHGFGKTWMFYEDEKGTVRLSNERHASNAVQFDTDNDEDGVVFRLYTRKSGGEPEIIQLNEPHFLENTTFNPSLPIKIVTHGWQSSETADSVRGIRTAYLNRGEYNVITVDWSKLAGSILYSYACSYTQPVGEKVAKLVQRLLKSQEARSGRRRRASQANELLSRIHIIGHSLGAHVAGHAGSVLADQKVSRITGLDPPWLGFEVSGYRSTKWGGYPSLSKNDAEFVDIVHTTAGTLGIEISIGHVDFYPNGGTAKQPGCSGTIGWTELCGHSRAHQYFAEAVNTDAKTYGSECESVPTVNASQCDSTKAIIFGEDIPLDGRGMYYFTTESQSPYLHATDN